MPARASAPPLPSPHAPPHPLSLLVFFRLLGLISSLYVGCFSCSLSRSPPPPPTSEKSVVRIHLGAPVTAAFVLRLLFLMSCVTPSHHLSHPRILSSYSNAGRSRACSWHEPSKLQVQTRISRGDALSTYLFFSQRCFKQYCSG